VEKVIAGANGSGKSTLLEAVAFALGASIKQLRVSNAQDIAGLDRHIDDEPGKVKVAKVEITLNLLKTTERSSTKPASAFVVGCGIIEVTLHFYYNDSKVPKSRHEELVTEVLGFSDSSTNTLSWFIRQRSIQSLVCPRLDTIGFNLVPNNSIATEKCKPNSIIHNDLSCSRHTSR
jgi:DNA repair exonuclease SbcCD ATPase subunit